MISPQTPAHSLALTQSKDLGLPLLSDPGNRTAADFGLIYTVPGELKAVYLQFGIDLPKYNDDHSWQLPLSARYIIERDRTVRYAAVNADYTVRPEPGDTIGALKELVD